ncbi:MAG: Crp/Fnr family transcriptional regulator [Clostridia bacterium]|nr:Crp/Fnr family transcriptional regulator [Clostridia bacterium]
MYRTYIKTLAESKLFLGIKSGEMEHLLGCMNPVIRKYKKGDVAAVEGRDLFGIGLVLCGTMGIFKTGITGNRVILGSVGKGDLFGETAAFAFERLWPATVESLTDSTVMYIIPGSIVRQCSNACEAHRIIQQNMLGILSWKAVNLTKRIEYMAIKGLKTKICTYIYNIYLEKGKSIIDLPMKRYELAEFFNVERPSLSREMIKLRDAGVLSFNGRQIEILDPGGMKKIIEGDRM